MRRIATGLGTTSCAAAIAAIAMLAGSAAATMGFLPVDEVGGALTAAAESTLKTADFAGGKPLQAVIMSVKGKADWRTSESSPWQSAKVDDLLSPGAHIRTGPRSSVALRVGRNASVLIRSVSSVTLPEIVQDGSVLHTTVGLAFGNADVKVDHVGLTNDFDVVTPTSVVSVRGTEFAVGWGGLGGLSLESSISNELRAIELGYFTSKLTFLLDGGARSSDQMQDPVLAALLSTIGPPPIAGRNVEGADLQQLTSQGTERDDVVLVQHALQQSPDAGSIFSAFASGAEISAYLASLIPASQPAMSSPPTSGGGTSAPPPPPPPPPPPLPVFDGGMQQPPGLTQQYYNNCNCPTPLIIPTPGGQQILLQK